MSKRTFMEKYGTAVKIFFFILISIAFVYSALKMHSSGNWIWFIMAPVFLVGMIVAGAMLSRRG